MNEKDGEYLNINEEESTSKIYKYFENIKNHMYDVQYYSLRFNSSSLWIEIFFRFIELFQLLAFCFSESFIKIQKPNSLFHIISPFFNFFLVNDFLKHNTKMYFIIQYSFILLSLILIFLKIYLMFNLQVINSLTKTMINIYSFIMYTFNIILVIPITNLYISIFSCTNKHHDYANFHCWNSRHYAHIIINMISLCYYLFDGYFNANTFFDITYNTNNIICKRTTFYDRILFVTKIFITIFFYIFNNSNDWVLIGVLIVCSGYNFYLYFQIQPNYNLTMKKLIVFTNLIFFWASIVLIITNIFKSMLKFETSILTFLLGIPFIIIFILMYKDVGFGNNVIHPSKMASSKEFFDRILKLCSVISDWDKRESQIFIRGYLIKIEENCINKDCPLNKAIKNIDNKELAIMYIYQHCDNLFNQAFSRDTNNSMLRILHLVFYLCLYSNKKKAKNELNIIEKIPNKSIEEEFVVYKCKKQFDLNGDFKFEEDIDDDFGSHILFLNNFNKFKSLITKISLLYIDFWGLLYESHVEHLQDMSKLNIIGSKINIGVQEIKDLYQKLQRIKPNNKELLELYEEFLRKVIFDYDQANLLKKILEKINSNLNEEDKEDISLNDFNLLSINNSDKNLYLVFDTNSTNFGTILNISLSLCVVLGYTKNEICGKNINVLIPEFLHKIHDSLLISIYNEHIKNNKNSNMHESKNFEYHNSSTFALNKSKYLVPFNFKSNIIQTDDNKNYWLLKINKENSLYTNFSGLNTSNSLSHIFYIITNNNFIIQNFTGNCVKLFGLTLNKYSKNVDIIYFIEEIHEEYLKYVIEKDGLTPEEKVMIKKNIINYKYKTPTLIKFSIIDNSKKGNNDNNNNDNNNNDNNNNDNNNNDNNNNNNNNDDFFTLHNENFIDEIGSKFKNNKYFKKEKLILSVKPITLLKEQKGYLFKLERIITNNLNSTDSSISKINNPHHPKTSERNSVINSNSIIETNKNFQKVQTKKQITFKPINDVNNSVLSNTSNNLSNSNLIDKYFLPALPPNGGFKLEPKKYVFKLNEKKDFHTTEILREKALEKLKENEVKSKKETLIDSKEKNEENSDSYSFNSNENEEDEDYEEEDEEEDEEIKKNKNKITTVNINTKNIDEDYYHVNFSKIKFKIYDFKLLSCLEKNFEKISKVQKTIELEINGPTQEEKQTQEAAVNIYKNIKTPEETEKENKAKKESLLKQIQDSLLKEESQPAIIKLKIISIFIFALIIGYGVTYLVIILSSFNKLYEKYNYIKQTFSIYKGCVHGVELIRELVLLSFDEYSGFYIDKDKYRQNYTNMITDLYFQNSEYIDILTKKSSELNKENYQIVFGTILTTYLINKNYVVNIYNLTYISTISKSVTCLFEISKLEIKDIFPLNQDIFFYIRNTLNGILSDTEIAQSTYTSQLYNLIEERRKLFILLFIITSIALLSSFLIIYRAFMIVQKRKDSYLEVFFEINGNVIISSLNKVEEFVQKQLNNKNDDFISKEEEEENIYENNHLLTPANNLEGQPNNHQKVYTKTLLINIVFFSMQILCVIYILIVLLIFFNFLNNLKKYTKIYTNETHLEVNILRLFNLCREYLFDKDSFVNNTQIHKVIDLFFYNYTSNHIKLFKELTEYQDQYGKDYTSFRYKLYKTDICNYTTFFEEFYPDGNINCYSFLNGGAKYGLETLMSNFVEQLREIKNKMKHYEAIWKEKNFTYNLSFFGHENYSSFSENLSEEELNEYNKYHPINLLNSTELKEMEIINEYYFIPIFKLIIEQLDDAIIKNFDKRKLITVSMSIIYISFFVIIYLFVWQRYVESLNMVIYKTKKMLAIIPKDILAGLTTIQKLLDIKNTNNNKNINDGNDVISKIGTKKIIKETENKKLNENENN